MFERIKNGFSIMSSTLKFVFRKPVFLIPIFFSLVTSTAANGAIIFFLIDSNTTDGEYIGFSLLMIFISSFFISLGQLIILELLEQHETDGQMRFFKAIGQALTRDLLRALPIIIVWSLIQFIFKLLDSLVSNREGRGRSILQSIIARLLRALKKGVHWGILLIMTAIAWEDVKPINAYRKAKRVYKEHFIEMLTGISISGLLNFLFILPALAVIFLAAYEIIPFSGALFIGILIWFVLIYCLGVVIEQIYAAELYLWYKVYEEQVEVAHSNNENGPESIFDIPRPTFFDDVPDMVFHSRYKKDSQVDN